MTLTEICGRLKPGIPLDICHGGRQYRHQMWYEDNFELSDQDIRRRRKIGLPCITRHGHPYINLQDFFDFHAGRIGEPEVKNLKKKKTLCEEERKNA